MQRVRSIPALRSVPWLLAVPLTLVFATFPVYPYIFSEALSEKAVLSYAHEHGWQHGTDIVFTYGPLGFLSSRYFFEHGWWLRFAVDLLFSLVVSAGVIRLAWRTKPVWRWLLIGTFLFLGANIDPRYDLLLYIGIFSWAMLCFVEAGRLLLLDVFVLGLITAFAVLVKANFVFLAIITIGSLAIDLCARRNWRMVAGLVSAFAMFLLLGWFAAEQSWTNLRPFFSQILPLASGYNQAVAIDGMQILRQRGFWAISLLCVAVLARLLNIVRFSVALWLPGVLLLIWKHGFVRGDMFHMGFFFGFTPFCALALEAFESGNSIPKRVSRVSALVCWALILFTLQRWCFAPLPSSLLSPFGALSANARVLLRSDAFKHEMLEAQQKEFARLELPKIRQLAGTNSVDVFGQDQLYALRNDFNYHPRPVFQSYMAYNAHLSRLNEQFYLSSSAPEYVLFRLTPIDRKFPPLEDSLVLRDLLLNYELTAEDPPYLLLKKRTIAPPVLTLLRTTTIRTGERFDLGSFGETNLWIELQVKPSALEGAQAFFYKPATVRLVVSTGKTNAAYKAPIPMLGAGFVASPLLLNDNDVREFYRGGKVLRPDAYSLRFDSKHFGEDYQCRIYSIAPGNPPGRSENYLRPF